ncbi:MAG: CHAT domain-containing protein, partial [Bacteroidia bacterium]
MRSQELGLAFEKKDIQKALKEAQKEAAEEDKVYKLPEHYGDLLIDGVERQDPDCYAFVLRAVQGGASIEEVREWWNLPDLERRMYGWEADVLHNTLFVHLLQTGYGEDEAFAVMKKHTVFFGDPSDQSLLTGEDRPLPPETRLWISAFIENATGSIHPATLHELAVDYSSINAFIRQQRTLGLWHEPLASINDHYDNHRIADALAEAEALLPVLEEQLDENDPSRIQIMLQLTHVFLAGGRYDITLEWLEKAVAASDQLRKDYPTLLNNLGLQYIEMSRFQDAVNCFVIATEWLKEHPEYIQGDEDFLWARILQNMALAYARAGQYADAVPIYEEVLEFFKTQESPLAADMLTLCQANLSLSLLGLGRIDEALVLQKAVIAKREKNLGTNHPHLATAYDSLGNTLREKKAYEEALIYLEKAANIRLASLSDRHPDYTLSLSNMALLHARLENWQEAVQLISQAVRNRLGQIRHEYLYLSENEQKAFYTQLEDELVFFRELAVKLHLDYPEVVPLLGEMQLVSRGLQVRSLTQLKQQIQRSENQELGLKFAEWIQFKTLLAEAYTQSEPPEDLAQWTREAQSLEKYLRTHSPDFGDKLNQQPSWLEIQKTLGEGELVLDCFVVQDVLTEGKGPRFAALILQANDAPIQLLTFPAGVKLDDTVLQAYHQSLKLTKPEISRNLFFEEENGPSMTPIELYHALWQPLEEAIGDAKKVYLLPDGIFYQINLQTVWHPDRQSHIGDLVDIQVLNHAVDLIGLPSRSNLNPVVLIGDPDFGPSETILALPGTRVEVEQLDRLFETQGKPSVIYLGAEANKSNLLAVENPRILHIATHGYFETELEAGQSIGGFQKTARQKHPYLRAGILLQGAAYDHPDQIGIHPGILTAYEAANLKLQNTDLVVLSACNSGVGQVQNGEGVYGLARAFREAGAQ